MADPTVFGLFGLSAFLAVLGVNLFLLWRHAPRLAEALGFAESRGRIITLLPEGEPNVVMLRPQPVRAVCTSPVRLAA